MKVLIVGLGSIAKKHIQALSDLEYDAEIYALRSSKDADAYKSVVNLYNSSDIPEDIDFVIISNPTHLHLQSIQDAVKLGKPLFIEKPVLRHTEEIAQLGSINVPTYVACVLRHHPCLQFVRDSLEGRTIKNITAYCGSYMPDWVPGSNWKESFRANEEQSGGVHLELIHELDYCYWLFGAPESVKSKLNRTGDLGIDIIDDAHYVLQYPDFSGEISVNYLDKQPRRTLVVSLDDTQWNVDLLGFTITENGEEIFSSDMTMREVYASQMQYFLNCMHSGERPMNSVQEASEVLTLALS